MTPGTRVVILDPGERSFWPAHKPYGGWATVAIRHNDDPWDTSIPVHFDDIPDNNTYSFPAKLVLTLYVIEEEPWLVT